MDSIRGFDHLHLVAKSINELYRGFGPQHLTSYADTFNLASSAHDVLLDPVIGTQYLAKRIAGHYRLPITTVIVTFTSPFNVPGRVELTPSNEFFVELQPQYRSVPKAIAAILAHEIAHIFLHRCGVRFSDEFENEILTDTTAVYLGFGPTILNAVTESTKNLAYFGYLTLDEFGYLLAKRDAVYGTDSASKIDPGISWAAFQCGRARYQAELRCRPFVVRPWHQRLFHFFGQRLFYYRYQPITFSCPRCSQGLRIPKAHPKLTVRCPNCDSRFLCYS